MKGSRKPAPPLHENKLPKKHHGGPVNAIGGRYSKRKRGLKQAQQQSHGPVRALLSPKVRSVFDLCLDGLDYGRRITADIEGPNDFFRRRIDAVKQAIQSLELLPSESHVTDGACATINPSRAEIQPGSAQQRPETGSPQCLRDNKPVENGERAGRPQTGRL